MLVNTFHPNNDAKCDLKVKKVVRLFYMVQSLKFKMLACKQSNTVQ